MNVIKFEPLNESHFTLIHRWFNQKHVQAFYSLRQWTLDEVHKKLTPYLHGAKGINSFIVLDGQLPIGYLQCCCIKDHPWEDQDLSDAIIQEAAGLDIFIGEEEYLGKGIGRQIVESFLKMHIWPNYRYCLADPDVRNVASIKLFQKCGFIEHKKIVFNDPLGQKVTLQLFIKER